MGERQAGVLADWNDDRGFGFITPDGGGPRVFAHISAFPRGGRPRAGSAVTYAAARDERNRPRATDVRYVGRAPSPRTGSSGLLLVGLVAALFFAVLAGLVVLREVPAWLGLGYGFVSGIAFLLYGLDKIAAEEGRRRISEATLHTVAVIGGWPGALIARPVLRHKTVKQPFRSVFWVTVIVNCAVLAWFVVVGRDLLGG